MFGEDLALYFFPLFLFCVLKTTRGAFSSVFSVSLSFSHVVEAPLPSASDTQSLVRLRFFFFQSTLLSLFVPKRTSTSFAFLHVCVDNSVKFLKNIYCHYFFCFTVFSVRCHVILLPVRLSLYFLSALPNSSLPSAERLFNYFFPPFFGVDLRPTCELLSFFHLYILAVLSRLLRPICYPIPCPSLSSQLICAYKHYCASPPPYLFCRKIKILAFCVVLFCFA